MAQMHAGHNRNPGDGHADGDGTMSIAQLIKRMADLERRVYPAGDRSLSLEEVHRMLWRQDRDAFLSLVLEGCNSARSFQEQFEQEEADRARQVSGTRACIQGGYYSEERSCS